MQIIDINGTERECATAYPDKDYPGYVKVEYKTKLRSYSEWYPIADFNSRNPNLLSITNNIRHVAEDITGVVTSSTSTAFSDKTQSWEKNTYAGFPVWISRGKGESQVRTVLSNTKNTIIIDKPWDIKPNKFSQYVLSRNIHDDKKAQNNILPQEIQHKYKLKAKKMGRDRLKLQQNKIVDANN